MRSRAERNGRFAGGLTVGGGLWFLLLIAELWDHQWSRALGCAVVTATLFSLVVFLMRRKNHRHKRRQAGGARI